MEYPFLRIFIGLKKKGKESQTGKQSNTSQQIDRCTVFIITAFYPFILPCVFARLSPFKTTQNDAIDRADRTA